MDISRLATKPRSFNSVLDSWIDRPLDMSLCPGPCLLHQGLRLLCCTESGALLLTVVVATSVFALMSAENSGALLLESIYSIFSSKKFGLGTARIPRLDHDFS
ncbi:uncharacterized protein ARMOST_15405 [Armillaria ostoyae]|uniref:Uncharacterized protein n=1 Tax=Armillaria ostoyae TaxID=47428 RepID=A0A284RT86_ARMOS|nr:uncharacterized protein ARMOST_15405 [Armillaria ostoyae]